MVIRGLEIRATPAADGISQQKISHNARMRRGTCRLLIGGHDDPMQINSGIVVPGNRRRARKNFGTKLK